MKGQSALEYLMTYGWALLIIVVVGAALYALGVLNPATYQQKTCTGMTYFLYQDHRLANDGAFDLQITNGNQDVSITDVNFGTTGTLAASVPMSPGQGGVVSGTAGDTGTQGSTYSVTVTITYDVTGGISGQTSTATCTGNFA